MRRRTKEKKEKEKDFNKWIQLRRMTNILPHHQRHHHQLRPDSTLWKKSNFLMSNRFLFMRRRTKEKKEKDFKWIQLRRMTNILPHHQRHHHQLRPDSTLWKKSNFLMSNRFLFTHMMISSPRQTRKKNLMKVRGVGSECLHENDTRERVTNNFTRRYSDTHTHTHTHGMTRHDTRHTQRTQRTQMDHNLALRSLDVPSSLNPAKEETRSTKKRKEKKTTLLQ